MQQFFNQIGQILGAFLPNLLWALIILVVGWVIATIVAGAIRKILEKTSLDNRLAEGAGMEQKAGSAVEVVVSKAVFYLIMLVVLIMVFEALQFTVITDPLSGLLDQFLAAIPTLVYAGVLIFVAWLLASFLRFLITKALGATKLDERFLSEAGLEDSQQPPLSEHWGMWSTGWYSSFSCFPFWMC